MNRQEEFEQAKKCLDQNFDSNWNRIVALADEGYERAMEFVALAYYRGDAVRMDEPLAYQWFQKIVRRNPGNGAIWNRIADCHFYGYGVPKNQQESIGYYLKAWENGMADAGATIGWIYAFGDIPERNEVSAAKWFQRSTDRGSLQGMYYIGLFYAEGYGGLPVSEKMAYRYMKQAAASDHYTSIWYLLCKKCYGNNEEFLALRNKLFKMAESGDDRAQEALGHAYMYGARYESGFGLEENPEESQRWFEKAAKQGNFDAIYELGKGLLDYESGFKVDLQKGEEYLLKAAEKGRTEACYELYRFYKWRKKDLEKALFRAEQSIEKNGDYFLNYEVAECYFKGIGTSVDYDKAAAYYRKCVNENPEDTNSNLSYLPLAKCLILSKNSTARDYKDSFVYLQYALDAASEKNYCEDTKGEVEYWIAFMLDQGLGLPVNPAEAFRHYSISAELGFEKASNELKHFKKTIFGWKKI